MQGLGFALREEAILQTFTEDVIKSNEIEGENLDRNQVRSSIALRLGMSAQVRQERDRYYETLEASQKGDLDITVWLQWFLECLGRTFDGAKKISSVVLHKADFWKKYGASHFNERRRNMLDRLLDDAFFGKLTSTKWVKLEKCSADTALRDITDLVERSILQKDPAGGRSTSYSLWG
jgi:Fic family protein